MRVETNTMVHGTLLPTMELLVYVAEVFVCNVSVNLSSADIRMPEQHLDRTQVRTVLEEIRSKTVPNNMRSDLFRDAGFYCIVFDYSLHRAGVEIVIFF